MLGRPVVALEARVCDLEAARSLRNRQVFDASSVGVVVDYGSERRLDGGAA